jgi:hypothetical protein
MKSILIITTAAARAIAASGEGHDTPFAGSAPKAPAQRRSTAWAAGA